MSDPISAPVQSIEATEPEPTPVGEPALVESELLVEDVSIDGMCGVY